MVETGGVREKGGKRLKRFQAWVSVSLLIP